MQRVPHTYDMVTSEMLSPFHSDTYLCMVGTEGPYFLQDECAIGTYHIFVGKVAF